jgi:sec-independent protein translocase protein TatC
MADSHSSQSSHSNEEKRMPLWEHLDDLRKGIIRSLIALAIAFVITYQFSEPVLFFLEKPLLTILGPQGGLYFTRITDKFFVYISVSCLSAIVLVLPYLLYELWRFISPALYKSEKQFTIPFICVGTITFFIGLAFAYYVVIPGGYKYLIEFGSPQERPMITLAEYFSFTIKLMLAIGLVFETPVLILLLAKLGLVDESFLVKNRKQAVVVSAIVSAVATPSPDAFTMLLVMIPLYLLYEASILGVRWLIKTPHQIPCEV